MLIEIDEIVFRFAGNYYNDNKLYESQKYNLQHRVNTAGEVPL